MEERDQVSGNTAGFQKLKKEREQKVPSESPEEPPWLQPSEADCGLRTYITGR